MPYGFTQCENELVYVFCEYICHYIYSKSDYHKIEEAV